MSNLIRFFTFTMFHGKGEAGSTRIRAHNLIKYWPEAGLYKYGEKPDVMIYQKVYTTYEYKFQQHFPGIQILDVCDPDWKDSPDIFIKETMDAMDAVVVPTERFKEYLQPMTDTPVRVIKDRFDLSEFPARKVHKGRTKVVVWFGYAHNAESIRFAIPSIEARGMNLVVISNDDPACWRWANSSKDFEKNYQFIKFNHPESYKDIQIGDVCLLMSGNRPLDMFKSENKTVIAQLLGLPVVTTAEELDAMMEADSRNKSIDKDYAILQSTYDCKKSVAEYRELIKEIQDGQSKRQST